MNRSLSALSAAVERLIFPVATVSSMKLNSVVRILTLLAAALLLAGCGSAAKVETDEFERAFASADPALKGPADEAAKAIKTGLYFEGATALANLAKSGESMTDEQKNALINVGASIQKVMALEGDKADLKVHQAVDDMMAALEGRESAKVGVNPDYAPPRKAEGE